MKASIIILSVATTLLLAGNGSHSSQGKNANSSESYQQIRPVIGTSVLSDEQKHTLAYMWNEEKLAKDIYLAINEVNPHRTLYNIATRAETKHQAAVETLIAAYDINISNLVDYTENYDEEALLAMSPGEFGIDELNTLYSELYLKGIQSTQDALEVGCMVEVTDINDLDKDIEIAQGADDIVNVFEHLREGSYRHYWAFDRALKSMGIDEGCCVLGDDFCKTADDYPINTHSNHSHKQSNSHSKGRH